MKKIGKLDEPYYEGERGFEEWFADQFTKAVVRRGASFQGLGT